MDVEPGEKANLPTVEATVANKIDKYEKIYFDFNCFLSNNPFHCSFAVLLIDVY